MDQSKIEESLGAILGYVERSAEFVGEQAPLIVSELLRYNAIKYGVLMVCLWAAAAGVLCVGRRWESRMLAQARRISDPVWQRVNLENEAEALRNLSYVASCVFLAFSLSVLFRLLKVVVAPRLFVLDYLRAVVG